MNVPTPTAEFTPLSESEVAVMQFLASEKTRYQELLRARQYEVDKIRSRLMAAEKSLYVTQEQYQSICGQWLALAERHYTPPGYPQRTVPTA